MTIQLKKLTYERIERSPEIQAWLEPFGEDRTLAIEMLLHLRFVSRDTYAEWLKAAIDNVREEKCAVFAVRKFDAEVQTIWDEEGKYRFRPAESLGSEDLVQSVIANLAKDNEDTIFDHPDVKTLRDQQVHQFVLIDDSIGSGKRVKGYLERLFNNKTIQSWWSYGRFRIVIIAFARVQEAEETVMEGIPGSDHSSRTYPRKQKVSFFGDRVYARDNLFQRWGPSYQQILRLCKNVEGVPRNRRRGYGNTMANIVFYHSVPNNLPGALWFQSESWNALFPQRSLPAWLPQLLDDHSTTTEPGEPSTTVEPNEDMVLLLRLAKRGIRNEGSLAWHVGLDRNVVQALLAWMRLMNLLTPQNRITNAGRSYLGQRSRKQSAGFDQRLYIPQTWCADREPVQPPGANRLSATPQAESDVGLLASDGEVGQASLEKTDAKTSSLGVIPELPSESRAGHDAHGPFGPKES